MRRQRGNRVECQTDVNRWPGHPGRLYGLIGLIIALAMGILVSLSLQVSAETMAVTETWNGLLARANRVDGVEVFVADEPPTGLVGDALIPPDLPQDRLSAVSDESTVPDFYQTSEYMVGRVAVGVVLLESDGSQDPSTEDWTEQRVALVQAKVAAAVNWWAMREPAAHLTFVYDSRVTRPVPTRYEPISRPSSDQKLWIGEAMAHLGCSDASYFTQVRNYVNDLRATYQTDWAFAVFVVDSSNDPDGAFADGYSAYAYLGGPFMVLTYDNGGYGADLLDGVAAHEMGHIFMALDQYATAQSPCTLRSGYLDVENQNSMFGGCASDQASIMRSIQGPFAHGQVDDFARGQIGWRDSDRDGVLDPVDTQIELSLTQSLSAETEQPVGYTGMVKDVPFPSTRRHPATINRITGVLYRLDGGEWVSAIPGDGDFGSSEEPFAVALPPLPEGIYQLDLLVRTSPGGERLMEAAEIVVVATSGSKAPLQKIQVTASADGLTLTCTGTAAALQGTVTGVQVRIDDGDWQPAGAMDGAFDATIEEFAFASPSPGAGVHTVQVQTVDSNGQASLVYQHTLNVQELHQVYLPAVIRNQ